MSTANSNAVTIVSPKFIGDALEMTVDEWLDVNNVHLRERFRNLMDSCALLGFDPPGEADYLPWCLDQLETERGLQIYCKEAP